MVRGRNEENIIEQAKTHSGLRCQNEEEKNEEKKENSLEQKKRRKITCPLKHFLLYQYKTTVDLF